MVARDLLLGLGEHPAFCDLAGPMDFPYQYKGDIQKLLASGSMPIFRFRFSTCPWRFLEPGHGGRVQSTSQDFFLDPP
jgi:hypothetical protein